MKRFFPQCFTHQYCLYKVCFYHIPVILVAELKHRQNGFKLVEDLCVPAHVCGQDTPEENTIMVWLTEC